MSNKTKRVIDQKQYKEYVGGNMMGLQISINSISEVLDSYSNQLPPDFKEIIQSRLSECTDYILNTKYTYFYDCELYLYITTKAQVNIKTTVYRKQVPDSKDKSIIEVYRPFSQESNDIATYITESAKDSVSTNGVIPESIIAVVIHSSNKRKEFFTLKEDYSIDLVGDEALQVFKSSIEPYKKSANLIPYKD